MSLYQSNHRFDRKSGCQVNVTKTCYLFFFLKKNGRTLIFYRLIDVSLTCDYQQDQNVFLINALQGDEGFPAAFYRCQRICLASCGLRAMEAQWIMARSCRWAPPPFSDVFFSLFRGCVLPRNMRWWWFSKDEIRFSPPSLRPDGASIVDGGCMDVRL